MKISVIIAAYNAEKYLVETLQSVVNQTLDDYEIITINDGSKDGTWHRVSMFISMMLMIY